MDSFTFRNLAAIRSQLAEWRWAIDSKPAMSRPLLNFSGGSGRYGPVESGRMYPNTYATLFPPFPRNHQVFIAMSFDEQFQPRWDNVIAPAVRRVGIDGKDLEPHRVNMRKASDSVLTEILEGIARSRFFIADITTIGMVGDRHVRNGNVLYEVGLAHALRRPEEVLLLRSDADELLFDVANIRVVHYDPDGAPEAAVSIISDAMVQSLRELDLSRGIAVRQAAEGCDLSMWMVLFDAFKNPIRHPQVKTMLDAVGGAPRRGAINRLLELGALRVRFPTLSAEWLTAHADDVFSFDQILEYGITPFGREIMAFCAREMNVASPDIAKMFENLDTPPHDATLISRPPLTREEPSKHWASCVLAC